MNKDQLKEEKEMEIDLLSLFFYLIQKWKILLLGAIIGGILAEGMTLLKTPMYQSTSTLYMLSKTTSITSMADLQLFSCKISGSSQYSKFGSRFVRGGFFLKKTNYKRK